MQRGNTFTHSRGKMHKITNECTDECIGCKVKCLRHTQHTQKVQAKRSEIEDMVHCDAVGSTAASVKDKHTSAHHPLHHALCYAVASPYWARTDIWSNLAQRFRTNPTRSDGAQAVLRYCRSDGAPEHGKSLDNTDITRE